MRFRFSSAINLRPKRFTAALTFVFAAVTAGIAGPAADPVHDAGLEVKYRISFLGVDLARANLVAKFEHGLYAARVGYRTTGIVKVFATATGDISATGAIDASHVIPAGFNQSTKENAKDSRVIMTLSQGVVTADEAIPEAPADPNRVPVKEGDRKNVLDPLSAIIIPVGRSKDPLKDVCNRTIPIFDGWTRFDVTLSFKALKTIDRPEYKGEAVTCAVRWVPIAGHIPERPGTKFMMENKNIEVTLAPIADTGYVVPLHIGIQTMHGHVDVDALQFTATKAEQAPAN
jgi:hypothetical protein